MSWAGGGLVCQGPGLWGKLTEPRQGRKNNTPRCSTMDCTMFLQDILTQSLQNYGSGMLQDSRERTLSSTDRGRNGLERVESGF